MARNVVWHPEREGRFMTSGSGVRVYEWQPDGSRKVCLHVCVRV
jgi:hypothetical protein